MFLFLEIYTLFWRLPTFALRLSSAQQRLTSLFGMEKGVTTASNHQNKTYIFYFMNFIEERKRFCLGSYSYFHGP